MVTVSLNQTYRLELFKKEIPSFSRMLRVGSCSFCSHEVVQASHSYQHVPFFLLLVQCTPICSVCDFAQKLQSVYSVVLFSRSLRVRLVISSSRTESHGS